MTDRTTYTLERLRRLETLKLNLLSFPIGMILSVIAFRIVFKEERLSREFISEMLLIWIMFLAFAWIVAIVALAVVAGVRARKRREAFYKNPELAKQYEITGFNVSDSDRKVIRKTYVKAELGRALLLSLIPLSVIGGVGLIVADFVQYSRGAERTFITDAITWMVILGVVLLVYLYCHFSAELANLGNTWDKLLQSVHGRLDERDFDSEDFDRTMILGGAATGRMIKRAGHTDIGSAVETAAGVQAGAFLFTGLGLISEQAKSLAGTFGVKLPDAKKMRKAVIIGVNILLMVLFVVL